MTDTVERWLPGLVPKGNKITVHQLLNHTSGLYDHERDPQVLKPYLSGNLGYYWSPLRLVKLAVTRKARFAPGASKISSYSSTNYLVLGLIVERVTGNPLGVELKRRIFQPLRLTRTTYPTTQTQLPSPYAHGYFLLGGSRPWSISRRSARRSPARQARSSRTSTMSPASTAPSSRVAFSSRKLLKAMMKTIPGGPDSDLKQREGYGLERFPTSCGAAWGHSGSFPGYKNYALSSADGKRQIVLMVNIDPTAEPEAARTLFYQLLDKAYCTAA